MEKRSWRMRSRKAPCWGRNRQRRPLPRRRPKVRTRRDIQHALSHSSSNVDVQLASGSGVGASAPILSFSGDAEDEGEDKPVDLFGQAAAAQDDDDDEDDEEHEGGEEDGEPEDDFNAAWEVLDLARAIYDKQKDEGGDEEVKLKLADTYIALGDVSLETGQFISICLYSFADAVCWHVSCPI